MKNKWKISVMLMVLTLILTGCMYPTDERAENQIPDQVQLDGVQRAIDEFRADTGVLPIKTRDMDTDIFIKYLVDFDKLVPKYLANSPGNSYEKGGIFQYIIWDPENNPTVKLVDLRAADAIRDMNIRFLATKYPTYKEPITTYVYTIDYEKLGMAKEITVPSPYSNNQLPLVVSTDGHVYVDYSIDLNLFIKENNLTPTPGEDIRNLLIEAYPVVPAYSLPYTVNENNEPVFMFDPTKENE
ncbi:hypothetical protein SAMN05877842_103337 [Ureibacillus acetophenoni]|uniref:Uncharacterized protein n=1 Tax=Ureibacillus acetophenoni TaxID=614649 RepID=A0A285U740_9BACL|nr:hypothetical protein SAMN05877842_103337 [Ureibacillus acetophenoni]